MQKFAIEKYPNPQRANEENKRLRAKPLVELFRGIGRRIMPQSQQEAGVVQAVAQSVKENGKRVEIPSQLAQLQRPWFEGRKVDDEIEKRIRFGSRIFYSGSGWYICKWRSGADGTIEAIPIDERTAQRFAEVARDEYFPDVKDKETAKRACEKLSSFLSERGVELKTSYVGIPHEELFELTLSILKILPDHHFGHEHFKVLKLGGWGSGNYKSSLCSAYYDSIVHLFTFAIDGPRRNYMALLLHEIGHSFVNLINEADLERLGELHRKIPKIGVDYLYGERSRINRQQDALNEFIAENYMHYVTQGKRLSNFICSLEPQHQEMWNELLLVYQKYFGGRIYI